VARLYAASHTESADALWTPSKGNWMTQAEADAMAAKEHAVDHPARVAELMNGPEGQSELELYPDYRRGSNVYLAVTGARGQAKIQMATYGNTAWFIEARRVALAERAFLQGGGQGRSSAPTLLSQLLPQRTSTPLPPPPPPPPPPSDTSANADPSMDV
jgi:hypothetical protein